MTRRRMGYASLAREAGLVLGDEADLTIVNDHGIVSPMDPDHDTVSISHFKAHCLALLARVKRTGQPLLVTRRGEPIAEVVPPSVATARGWLGSAASTGRITGDIVAPASDWREWEVLRR